MSLSHGGWRACSTDPHLASYNSLGDRRTSESQPAVTPVFSAPTLPPRAGLDSHFKLNIEPNHTTLAGHAFEHDIIMASKYGFLGSIDANTGTPELGWDTDQFLMEPKKAALVMLAVIEQGGLGSGVLNFDAKVRRESTDVEDMFIAHAAGMDTFARGLRAAAKIAQEGTLAAWLKQRYSSYDSGIGAKIEGGRTDFKELESWVVANGDAKPRSGQQEKFEQLLNAYV